jgi:hypothetical protein
LCARCVQIVCKLLLAPRIKRWRNVESGKTKKLKKTLTHFTGKNQNHKGNNQNISSIRSEVHFDD